MRGFAKLLAFVNLLIVGIGPAYADSIVTPRVDAFDRYHGVTVRDPYRWLENADDIAVRKWTEAQNKRTRAYFDTLATRKAIEAKRQELTIKSPLDKLAAR